MAIAVKEHKLLPVRRDGQIGGQTASISSSGGGFSGGGGTTFTGGTGIIITGNTIKVDFGATSTQVARGSHTHTLNNLSDVNITTPLTNHILQYNGTCWCNTSTVGLSLTANCPVCYNGSTLVSYAGGGGGATCLDALTDVVISSPSNGQIIQHNGTTWCNTSTTTLSLTCNEILCYNGTAIVSLAATTMTVGNALALCSCVPACFAAATHCHCNLYNASNVKACTTSTGLCIIGCAYSTDFIASSDKRLKTDVTPIYNALSTVLQLKGVYYKLNNTNECNIGMIAQDVIQVLPMVVKENDGYYGIEYSKITAILIEAVKEQQKCIYKLEDRINERV